MVATMTLLFSERAVQAVVEELDAAADRVIEHQVKAEVCKTCGRSPRILTPGHVYLIIGCCMFLAVALVGALSK
jgi:hypothetical protein